MKIIFLINKLFILLLLSIGITVNSYSAGPLDHWSDKELCEWTNQPSPPGVIQILVNKRKIFCSGGIVSEKVLIVTSDAFDGTYPFKLFADSQKMGKNQLGAGLFEIKDGIITIATENRMLAVGSKDKFFNSFEGRVGKSGEVITNFLFNPCGPGQCGGDKAFPVNGTMDKLKLNGEFLLGTGPDVVKIIFELKAN